MKTPKPLQELYAEIKDFDLVLTSDNDLANALNRLVKTARVGRLACTPQEIAKKHSLKSIDLKPLGKHDLILEISRKSKKNIKTVHSAVEKIIEIEKNSEDILPFLEKNEKEIYTEYSKFPNEHKSISEFKKNILPQNIAVVEPGLFNKIEKKILPDSFKEISLLTEKSKSFSDFYLFSSQEEMVDSLMDLINRENQNDIAIILETKSGLMSIIKSRLYEKKIDIKTKEFLHEHLQTRTFIDLLQTALYLEGTTVKEVKPFLEVLGVKIPYNYNSYLLSNYAEEISGDRKLKEIYSFLSGITGKTYKQYYKLFKGLPKELRKIIKELGLHEQKISQENFLDIKYFIRHFKEPIEENKKGVVLVDCHLSTSVDRPVCLYANPDISWTKQIPDTGYIDKDFQEQNNLKKFQILLSQGDRQLYFAQSVKYDEKNIPCFYFNQLEKREINSFNDPFFNGKNHSFKKTEQESNPEIINNKTFSLDFFSQNSLNNFFSCAKKFEFSKLAPGEQKTYFLKGNLLHAYAEFYANYKELCNDKGDSFFTDLLLKEYMQMVSKLNKEVEETFFKIGIKNIKAFIDSLTIDKNHNLTVSPEPNKQGENIISKILGKPLSSSNTEFSFQNKNTKMRGIIDLVISSKSLADYKSSKKAKSIREIVSKSNLNLIDDEADFQPLFYLSELAARNPGQKLSFFYCFFMNNKKDVINEEEDLSKNIVEINYYPITFSEFITSSEGMEIITSKGRRKEICSALSEDLITSTLKEHPLKNIFQSNYKNSDAYKILEQKTTEKEALDDFFKEIVRIRTGRSRYRKALFFKEDLEKFQTFAQEQYEKIRKHAREGFPKNPRSRRICERCDYRDMCFVGC